MFFIKWTSYLLIYNIYYIIYIYTIYIIYILYVSYILYILYYIIYCLLYIILIPKESHWYITRTVNYIPIFWFRTDTFKYSFFPWSIKEWNKIGIKISKFFIFGFHKLSAKKISLQPTPLYNTYNPYEINLLTWLRLRLSHSTQI